MVFHNYSPAKGDVGTTAVGLLLCLPAKGDCCETVGGLVVCLPVKVDGITLTGLFLSIVCANGCMLVGEPICLPVNVDFIIC